MSFYPFKLKSKSVLYFLLSFIINLTKVWHVFQVQAPFPLTQYILTVPWDTIRHCLISVIFCVNTRWKNVFYFAFTIFQWMFMSPEKKCSFNDLRFELTDNMTMLKHWEVNMNFSCKIKISYIMQFEMSCIHCFQILTQLYLSHGK